MTSTTLDRWLADEAAQRERTLAGAGYGAAAFEHMAQRDGLQQLQAQMRGEAPAAQIGRTLHFMLIDVAKGRAVFQGEPREEHYNPMGAVHGGWFATLLDAALGCAVASALPLGKAYTTLELKLNMIRALSTQVPRVRAEGQVIHVGGQTATAEARLVGPDGKLYAHGSTTCLVFELRPPAGKAAAPA